MHSNTARYSLLIIVIHWISVPVLVVLFAMGWFIHSMPQEAPARSLLLDLHASLGLTSALLVSFQIILRLIYKTPSFPDFLPMWEKRLTGILYIPMYILLVLMPLSGYLQSVFSSRPVYFWGFKLPLWGVMDSHLSAFLFRLHSITALVLACLILVHVGLIVFNALNGNNTAYRMLASSDEPGPRSFQMETVSTTSPAYVRKLAKNLRLFGWLGFWLQFVLAFIAGLLLVIAAPGLAFSSGAIGTGNAMSWASYGFVILCAAVLMALNYIRVAGKVLSRPEAYLTPRKKISFWFLGAGTLNGLIGILLAFGGMFLSLSLLIGKTVSQPPGIAITDPQRIIRALDVFILMVNFDLLLAHFIGAGISLWLSLQAGKARLEYSLSITDH